MVIDERIESLDQPWSGVDAQGRQWGYDFKRVEELLKRFLRQTGIIALTQSEYDALSKPQQDVLYVIVDRKDTPAWHFGDKFPVVFGGKEEGAWHFGDSFPIVLTSKQ